MTRRSISYLPSLCLLAFGLTTVACGSDYPPGPVKLREPEAEVEEDEPQPVESEPETPAPPPPPAEPVCEGQTKTYDPMPPRTNVLFLVDRSGSMHAKIPNGNTRWSATRSSLFSMLDKLPAKNARASVMLFPQGDAALESCCTINANNDVVCNCASYPAPTQRCNPASYVAANPADLDATRIAAMKAAINITSQSFYWGTPLAAALTAAINVQKSSKNDGIKSVILLTDGAPTSCETASDPMANDIQRVVDAARLGMTGTEKIRTYVLGIMDGATGARADLLSKVAVAGGTARFGGCSTTDSCFYPVDVSTFATTLTSSLERIARESTDCTFDIPAAESDPEKIDVTLARKGGPQLLDRDKTRKQGWDVLEGGKQIKLYGEACRVVKDDASAKVQIVVGCEK